MGLFNWGRKAESAGNGVKAAGEGIKAAGDGVGSVLQNLRSLFTGDMPPNLKVQLVEIEKELEVVRSSLLKGQQEIEKAAINKGGIHSVFLAGWRPFIGWVGGFALFMYFIPQFISANFFWIKTMLDAKELVPFPVSPDGILELVIGILGLGAMRSFEKNQGIQAEH